MALITRSLIQLAADLRIGDGETALTGPAAVVLERIAKTAKVLVVRYAPNAPDAIHDEAFVRVAGWLYDAGPDQSTPGARPRSVAPGPPRFSDPYRVRRGGVIGQAVEEAVAAAAPGNHGNRRHSRRVHFDGHLCERFHGRETATGRRRRSGPRWPGKPGRPFAVGSGR